MKEREREKNEKMSKYDIVIFDWLFFFNHIIYSLYFSL